VGYALPFTRDHPHIKSPKGVMSCDEIRFWIRYLLEQEGWRPLVLARAIGIHTDNRHAGGHVRRKLDADEWIYPGEQIRFTRGLRRVLAGELVCRHLGGNKWGCVVADNPVPLRLPTRMRYNLAAGRLEYAPTTLECKPSLPSFRDVLTRAERWRV